MAAVSVLPVVGDILWDARDGGRFLRMAWHPTQNVCVLSLWRDDTCLATFHLSREAAPEMIDSLVRGLAAMPAEPWSTPQLTLVERQPHRQPTRARSWLRRRYRPD